MRTGPVPYRKPRGLTLVELLVAFLLVASIAALLWQMLLADQQRHDIDQNRLTGLHGVLIFHETLMADLKRLAFHLNPAEVKEFNSNEPYQLDEDRQKLRFRVYRTPTPSRGEVPTSLVEYYLDRRTSSLARRIDDDVMRFANVRALSLRFTRTHVAYRRGLAVDGTWNLESGIDAIKYEITCISEVLQQRPEETRREVERITIAGSIPLDHMEEIHDHPYHMLGSAELLALPAGR